ncbi:hypothetical protein [Bacillus luti]
MNRTPADKGIATAFCPVVHLRLITPRQVIKTVCNALAIQLLQ